ncbi:hypothetical protein IPM62_00385 [Candidatus Woesebacteria bacterium]|nr:MAG: hypothetical protein IPM62_00385 [Candidatus Woesebacteria bacterium]
MKLPLFFPDRPLSTTTQNHLPIAEIFEDLVLYKNGAVTLILESTSLNFGLLSENEQEAVIAGYAGLLNSLTFHIQIVVRSLQKDISNYLILLDDAEKSISNPKLTEIMRGYKKFMSDSIKKKNVLSKKFYIVLPFTQYELGVSKSFSLPGSKQTQPGVPYTKAYVVRKAKIALYPKREHIARQARRLGLNLRQLKTDELIDLVYNIYNPEPPIKERGIFN